jgi:NADPH:quinone reductase-like Zn-dependent oxidoreductase
MSLQRSSMTAGWIHRFGPPAVIEIEQIPIPQPGEGEVLLRVEAAGVGPWDGWIRSGHSWLPQPLPLTLGSDIVGIVEHVDLGVTAFKSGDPVFGVSNARFTVGYAEFSAASAMMLARRPESLSALEAASVPVVAVTALQMLFTHANVERGQTVLIHGAPAMLELTPCNWHAGKAAMSWQAFAARRCARSRRRQRDRHGNVRPASPRACC